MGYRSRWHAAQLRITAFHERLDEAEQLARERLGGALPYAVETRLAALEPALASFRAQEIERSSTGRDLGSLASELEAVVGDLEALARGEQDDRRVDEAFVDWVKRLARRRPHRAIGDDRTRSLTAMLRRVDPDAGVDANPNDSTLEARLNAHGCPLYYLGQLGREIDTLIATPVPRQAGRLCVRPFRWWRRLEGWGPADLGHEELDGRFTLEASDATISLFERAHAGELREALAALCHFDEPTLHVEGAAATLTFSYDVAYEPLAAATRVLAALRKVLSPPPPPPPSKPRRPPRPILVPVVPAQLRQRRR